MPYQGITTRSAGCAWDAPIPLVTPSAPAVPALTLMLQSGIKRPGSRSARPPGEALAPGA